MERPRCRPQQIAEIFASNLEGIGLHPEPRLTKLIGQVIESAPQLVRMGHRAALEGKVLEVSEKGGRIGRG